MNKVYHARSIRLMVVDLLINTQVCACCLIWMRLSLRSFFFLTLSKWKVSCSFIYSQQAEMLGLGVIGVSNVVFMVNREGLLAVIYPFQ